MREVLRERLSQWGFTVEVAEGVADARRRFASEPPDLVLSDVVMGDGTGVDLLDQLAAASETEAGDAGSGGDVPVVLITAHATVDLSVEAMKKGASDFLTKPLDYDKLRATLDANLHELRSRRRQRRSDETLAKGAGGLGDLVGDSAAMRRVYEQIEQVAGTDASVLITGESGTGKEVTARTVHRLSRRAEQPFVAINAAAIPAELMESEIFGHEKGAFTGATSSRAGCFELAHGGTLFLDEIAEMSPNLQPKLLRILEEGTLRRLGSKEERRVDVRVLAATNQDPEKAIAEGKLRADLFYRLNVFGIVLPPLRERREDVDLLTRHFLRSFRDKHGAETPGFRDSAAELLQGYHWPGNVRELRNVVERAVIVARDSWIEPGHLPPYLEQAAPAPADAVSLSPGTTVAEAERALILRTLEETGNNKAAAARQLGIDVKTVRNKLKSYGLTD
ncbi:MAG: sigma-54-dependent Fis family transcriptional regulator [Acidobacteria bacterium]|nr:MAG: sigma-54-dependent Fis family transcriptional regulator [Acidobacteriota bacterium]REK00564.1 MAG: sigma-54-dependent Fis family transcriptional regulator [Acidobacteriota bacterium]